MLGLSPSMMGVRKQNILLANDGVVQTAQLLYWGGGLFGNLYRKYLLSIMAVWSWRVVVFSLEVDSTSTM
jgi:hypothetical protein